ncbi:MAG: thioesterase family protein [Patulibacter minatonensis]
MRPVDGAPGSYACAYDRSWATAAGINGGILMATLVRAIELEVGADRPVRSLQVQFLRPPRFDEAQITVETIRAGARATNLRLRIDQGGKRMVEALATCFVPGLPELARWSPVAPPVEAPHADDEEFLDPRMPPIVEHLSYRPRIGPPPFSGAPLGPGEPARTGGWLELRDPHPIDPALLAFYVDAWWPAALGPITTTSLNPTIDLALRFRTALPTGGLPPQPLLLESTTATAQEGLVDEVARVYTADGVLLAEATQLAITLTPDERPVVTRRPDA